MKHIITDPNDSNEQVRTNDFLVIDSLFGNFVVEFSLILNLEQQSHLGTINTFVTTNHKVIDISNLSNISKNEFWSLYFDISKSKEGADVGCMLRS